MNTAADDLLLTPLDKLAFPARIETFIARRRLATVRDLLAFAPASLKLEPNLGRKSVADAIAIIDAHLGVSWERARSAFVVTADASAQTAPLTPTDEWTSFRSRVPAELLEREVRLIEELPTRIHTFVTSRRIRTVAELLAVDYERLTHKTGIGAGTLRETVAFFRERCLAPVTREEPSPPTLREAPNPLPEGSTWRTVFQQALRDLAPNERLILTQRAGLAGPIPTLAELGELLGVSRERIRQLESRGIERVRRSLWVEPAMARLETAAPRAVVLLDDWQPEDPLLVRTDGENEPFRFFVNDVLAGALSVFRIEDMFVLSRVPKEVLEERLETARRYAPDLPFPLADGPHLVALAQAMACSVEEVQSVSPLLATEWIVEDGKVSGFGTTKESAILAYMRSIQRPASKGELEERFGRARLPDALVFVERGLLALPETIPDWERWRKRVPAAVRRLIERHGPERQWTTYELLPLLAEEAELPAWLDHWSLGSLLRDAPDVRYLGRNVVALTEPAEGRLHVHELIASILDHAGKALAEEALLGAISEKRGFGQHTWALMKMRRPLVVFDDGRVGLLPRDVPGGEETARRFGDAVFAQLDLDQVGLRTAELKEAWLATAPSSGWDGRLARSLLRHDGRFRCAPGGAVGLSEWEDVRAPSQRDVLEELMVEHDGIVPIEVAMNELPTVSGEPLDRGRIGLLANSIRARLIGPYIEWMPEAYERIEERSSLLGRVLAALPEDTVGVFRELVERDDGAPVDVDTLERWRAGLLDAAKANPNIEVDQVERLAARGRELIERIDRCRGDADVGKVCRAAIRYLASIDDATTDTALGGLDDDEAVVETVLGVTSA